MKLILLISIFLVISQGIKHKTRRNSHKKNIPTHISTLRSMMTKVKEEPSEIEKVFEFFFY